MISFAEFEIALLGLLRLARFDAGFAGFFDLTRNGARRSFRLALPLLPVTLLLVNLNTPWPAETDTTRIVLAELISYVLFWVAFPLLLIVGAKLIDREARVFGAIAIYNWLGVLNAAILLPIEIACYYGLDESVVDGLSYARLAFIMACEFFAFMRILQIRFELALVLVAIDFMISVLLSNVMFALALAPA